MWRKRYICMLDHLHWWCLCMITCICMLMLMCSPIIQIQSAKRKSEDLYSALLGKNHSKALRHGSHSFNLQRTPRLPLPRKRSPDGASTECGGEHLIAAHYSFIDPERMKGLVGLVGWPIADGLPTYVVTHQLQVERRTAKERWPETDVLSLSQGAK